MWKNYSKESDKMYEQSLKRAKTQLPDISVSDSRFVIPQVDSQIEGNRTFFRNFRSIVTTLRRPETHFLKFFTNELGTSGNVEGDRVIFQGKHNKVQIAKLLDRYVNDYVICPECKKPDTRFMSQGRVTVRKCDACGAINGLRNVN